MTSRWPNSLRLGASKLEGEMPAPGIKKGKRSRRRGRGSRTGAHRIGQLLRPHGCLFGAGFSVDVASLHKKVGRGGGGGSRHLSVCMYGKSCLLFLPAGRQDPGPRAWGITPDPQQPSRGPCMRCLRCHQTQAPTQSQSPAPKHGIPGPPAGGARPCSRPCRWCCHSGSPPGRPGPRAACGPAEQSLGLGVSFRGVGAQGELPREHLGSSH